MDQLLPSKPAAKPADVHMLELPVLSATKELVDGHHTWTTRPKSHAKGAITCEEEGKIRGQIENDIERNLEEEIKDGIYRLALRLHRVYQHKRERMDQKEASSLECSSWLNISIGLTQGRTKVEIKEMMINEKGRPRTGSRLSRNNFSRVDGSKFDWTKSLRASSPGSAGPRNVGGSNCKGVEVAWKF